MSTIPRMPPYARTPVYFLLLLLVGFAGFYPSYLTRLRETDFARHAHGLTAFAWMALLITQATLIRLHLRHVHRRVGRLALVLVPLFVAAGLWLIWDMTHADNPFARRFAPRLALVDLSALLGFVAAFALAMKHRRDIHRHARYMAATGLLILPPALARLAPHVMPVSGFEMAFHVGYFATEALTTVLIGVSARRHEPVLPFALLLGLLLSQQAGFQAGLGLG